MSVAFRESDTPVRASNEKTLTTTLGNGPLPVIDLQAQRRRLGDRIEGALGRVLEHGRFLAGPEVGELERRLAEHSGVRHALACASGTDALVMALLALEVRPGDAVLVPGYTFVATAEAVALLGATPVFLDVRPHDFNMDPEAIAIGVSTAKEAGLNPVGVISVDLFGHPADYDAIEPATAEQGLWLVCDAAQSFGSVYRDRPAGSIGRIATTSFYPAKPLGCYGDGGAVLTDDDSLAEVMVEQRDHGRCKTTGEHVRVGITGRLDTFQAAILLEKLSIFSEELELRSAVANRYQELAESSITDFLTPRVSEGLVSTWAQYTMRLPAGSRDSVQKTLGNAGIHTAVHYRIPLHRQPAYRSYPVAGGRLPVAEGLSEKVLSLPMHPYLSEADQNRVVATMVNALTDSTV